jgi:hypothetical protein
MVISDPMAFGLGTAVTKEMNRLGIRAVTATRPPLKDAISENRELGLKRHHEVQVLRVYI